MILETTHGPRSLGIVVHDRGGRGRLETVITGIWFGREDISLMIDTDIPASIKISAELAAIEQPIA
jgi:hypothetical protein